MKPVLSADGEKIGWLNYKTGHKHIAFKMDADSRKTSISIVLDHPDDIKRQLLFERFGQMKAILFESLEADDWIWKANITDEHGRPISSIHDELTGVNIFRHEDWSAIISFLKPRIIALDNFWSMVRFEFRDI